jgi:hypothetical protein
VNKKGFKTPVSDMVSCDIVQVTLLQLLSLFVVWDIKLWSLVILAVYCRATKGCNYDPGRSLRSGDKCLLKIHRYCLEAYVGRSFLVQAARLWRNLVMNWEKQRELAFSGMDWRVACLDAGFETTTLEQFYWSLRVNFIHHSLLWAPLLQTSKVRVTQPNGTE